MQIQAIQGLLLFFIIMSFILGLLGIRQSRLFLFPLLLILITLPVWDGSIYMLRTLTAVASSLLLKVTGFSHLREGFLLVLPSGTFEVADGCSGLRYQLAGISIALLFVYMTGMRFYQALVFIILTALMVLFANILRVYIVVVAGEMTRMQSDLVNDHQWLGWLVFAVVITLFLWFSGKFFRIEEPGEEKEDKNLEAAKINTKGLGVLVIAIMMSLTGPVLAKYYSLEKYRGEKVNLVFPSSIGDWKKIDVPVTSNWRPRYTQSNGVGHAHFQNQQGQIIEVFIYQYIYQEQGREAITTMNRDFSDASWNLRKVTNIHHDSKEGSVQALTVKTPFYNKIIYKWYYTNRKRLASQYKAKIENLISRLKGNPQISVILVSPVGRYSDLTANAMLSGFYRSANSPLVNLVEGEK
jgi:EpsI family protein